MADIICGLLYRVGSPGRPSIPHSSMHFLFLDALFVKESRKNVDGCTVAASGMIIDASARLCMYVYIFFDKVGQCFTVLGDFIDAKKMFNFDQ